MRSTLRLAILALLLLAAGCAPASVPPHDHALDERVLGLERDLVQARPELEALCAELVELESRFATERSGVDDVPTWVLRSRHFIYGMPEITHRRHNFVPEGHDDEQPGISVLVREGFVIGHLDRFKTPLWVSMRWTREDLQQSLAQPEMPRNFRPDTELPEYARASPDYRGSVTGYDRGHMARHADNRAWGRANSDAGNLMSNIAPQSVSLNRRAWLSIENAHRFVVRAEEHGIDTVWIISGCLFEDDTPVEFIANGVAVPQATFKVIAWFDDTQEFHARGYIVPQEASVSNPALYLVPIREIEYHTGLNFFPELDQAEQDRIEIAEHETIWH